MSFSENIIGRSFTWGGIELFILETRGDSVLAVFRDDDDSLIRIRIPTSQALQTIDAHEVVLCDAPIYEQKAG